MNTFLNYDNMPATIEIKTGHHTINKTWGELTDSDKQDIASEWIRENVYCNVNQVMELLGQNDDHWDYDEYRDISESKDYDKVSENHINDLSESDLLELFDEYYDDLDLNALEENHDLTLKQLTIEQIQRYVINNIDLDQYGEDNDLDPNYSEAYEFWSVSSHFAAHIDNCASDILGLSVWGRFTTGQAICLDHQIQIAAFKVLSDAKV